MGATSTPIQRGRTEPIRLDVRDGVGDPFTGATGVLVRVQRESDGEFLDFSDLTFKAAGWTTRDPATVAADASLLPGIYELTGGFPSGSVTNLVDDDAYIVYPVNSGAGDTFGAVLPPAGEFKIGWASDAVGLTAVVSATIGSAVPDTLELMAWLVRDADVVASGLVGATIEVQDVFGATVVASGAMSGPTSAGVFRRSVASVSLAIATNYVAILTITDANGAYTSYTAVPTLG